MRIAIDYTPAIRQRAGIGRYTQSLVAALARLDVEWQFTLFCAGGNDRAARWPANFAVRRTRIPARWLTAGWHRLGLPLPVEVFVGRCDLFHSPDFTLPPLRAARGVVTIHDLSFIRFPHCADPGLRAYLQRAVPIAVQRAHRVLADSSSTRADLIDLLQVPPEKISVVPAGVDPRFSRVVDAQVLSAARSRYRLPERFILSVGTLEPRKNLARLVSAFALARRQADMPHALVIAGRPGWMYEEIYRRVAEEGLEGCVHFVGYVADDDLPSLYSLADLMVFPSLYEGFGMPPLEAMACGTPVVCSNSSSLPETVGDGAILVNPEKTDDIAAAIVRVLGDAELQAALLRSGKAQAARFSWHEAATKLLAAYRAALA